jgi:protein-S-isoprenylcysteine O-methyltransferase Ste14
VQPPNAPHLVQGLFVATLAITAVVELRQSTAHRAEATPARGAAASNLVLRASGGAGILLAVLARNRIPSAAFAGSAALAAWLGLVVMWLGLALRFWSFRSLGRYFTFTIQTSADQPVITDGPYQVIRHPSYAGLLLAVLGAGVLFENWLSLACLTLAFLFAIILRVRLEDRVLLRELGAPYAAYAATHKRLVPYVW